MKRFFIQKYLQKLIGVWGIIFIYTVLVFLWFREGLLFAGAEDGLSYYNHSKSLAFYSSIWSHAAAGTPGLFNVPRAVYFFITDYFFKLGISNVILQAVSFWALILTGTLSVYYLVRETVNEVKQEWKKWVPFLAGLFYFFNPFAMTQMWGRALSFQFFSFALVPSFLLFFVLSLKRKNLFFCVVAGLISFLLSSAYENPGVVLASWTSIVFYFVYYVFRQRKNKKDIVFACISVTLLGFVWLLVNFFWIAPVFNSSKEAIGQTLSSMDNVESLKALRPNSRIYNVIRLIHREYYDGTYGAVYNNLFFVLISWLLPVFGFFAISAFKKSKHFLFYSSFLLVSVFVTIGANLPTGPVFVWLFKHFTLLQVLRNPYEKFGVNLILAYAPFAAIGMLVVTEKLAIIFRKKHLQKTFLLLFIFLEFVVLVWPYWNRQFAGGVMNNFWVQVPDYYQSANNWLNSQEGDFRLLHTPLLPDEGITYTWDHYYIGIEQSEYLFDKPSIARNTRYNLGYYVFLIDRLHNLNSDFTDSGQSSEFKDISLSKELAKLNVKYIIVHKDIDYKSRRAISPEETEQYLEKQPDVKKVQAFGKLDIYEVERLDNNHLIYSPDTEVEYQNTNNTLYKVNVKVAKGPVAIYFLENFHPGWEAFVDGKKVENHSKIFSYGNSWLVNKTGDFQMIIKYKPQAAFELGLRVSAASVLTLAVLLGAYWTIVALLKIRKLLF